MRFPNFNSGVAEPALKLGHGWVTKDVTSYPCRIPKYPHPLRKNVPYFKPNIKMTTILQSLDDT